MHRSFKYIDGNTSRDPLICVIAADTFVSLTTNPVSAFAVNRDRENEPEELLKKKPY